MATNFYCILENDFYYFIKLYDDTNAKHNMLQKHVFVNELPIKKFTTFFIFMYEKLLKFENYYLVV